MSREQLGLENGLGSHADRIFADTLSRRPTTPHRHLLQMEVSYVDTILCALLILLLSARPDAGTTWHRILSFSQNQNNYLRTLPRGARVYVEANLEVREPQQDAEPGSPTSMRQVFLRHGMYTSTLD
jgi:hypothetical protein